jgi:hypothetical protein
MRAGALVTTCVVIAATAATTYTSIMRFKDNAYFLDTPVRTVLSKLPSHGNVDLEGFEEGPVPIVEQGLVYMLAEEHAWNRVSLPADANEDGSLDYLGGGGLPLTGPQFKSNYEYVLTRIPGVHTNRKVLDRDGGVALEQRTTKLDVTPDYGLSVPALTKNPSGIPLLNPYTPEPIKFVVSGRSSGPAYVRISFYLSSGTRQVSVLPSGTTTKPASTVKQAGHYLDVCVEASGTSPIRTALVQVKPLNAVALVSMGATTRACGPSTSTRSP